MEQFINKIFNEPCLETISKLPDNSVDCIISSPPYWQLRDYGYDGQWGLEPTFEEYLQHLWQLMDGIYRVLKPEGTCWINLGDTYARGQRPCDAPNQFNNKDKESFQATGKPDYQGLNKCLLLLPHRFAIGCIDRGWIVRNDCIWAKRNCMPESVTDRFSKKHEYFFFMVKSEKYYFDLDAIRDANKSSTLERSKYGWNGRTDETDIRNQPDPTDKMGERFANPKGKNPGDISDFWDITTKGSSEKHYASYNDSLLVKPVLAGCPEEGIIYDPFMGTGSTAEVALRSNRKFIGSEMSQDYCDIANKRLKPFLMQTNLF